MSFLVGRHGRHAFSSPGGLEAPPPSTASPPPADCLPELERREQVERLPPTDDVDGGRDSLAAPSSDPRGERVDAALESVR